MTKQVDVAILGGGTGGYIAAIAAAQAGKSVAVIEREKLGGTCLHRGCIPSKALLRSAEIYRQAGEAASFGVEIEGMRLNFDRVQARKQKVVDQLHNGVQFLMKKYNIEVIRGVGRIMGPSIFSPKSGSVAVECEDGDAITVVPNYVIIATGSRPRKLQGLPVDHPSIVTTDEALEWDELPKRVAILGGGVIGVEWASMLIDFGVEVTVIESASHLIPQEDRDVSTELQRQLAKRGVRIHTDAIVESEKVQIDSDTGEVRLQITAKGQAVVIHADKLLVCIGRQANIENIGLENAGIEYSNGRITVNEYMQTNESHIYAIGDVIGGLQLAHAASAEGILAVRHLCGEAQYTIDSHRIPRCIYTSPETASIGWTEKEAVEAGYSIKTSKVPFKAIGKAIVQGDTSGFVKIIANSSTNDLLGVHIVGPHATELIGEAAVAQWLDATPWEVGEVIHPHPSLSEIMGEAMLAVDGRALNL